MLILVLKYALFVNLHHGFITHKCTFNLLYIIFGVRLRTPQVVGSLRTHTWCTSAAACVFCRVFTHVRCTSLATALDQVSVTRRKHHFPCSSHPRTNFPFPLTLPRPPLFNHPHPGHNNNNNDDDDDDDVFWGQVPGIPQTEKKHKKHDAHHINQKDTDTIERPHLAPAQKRNQQVPAWPYGERYECETHTT